MSEIGRSGLETGSCQIFRPTFSGIFRPCVATIFCDGQPRVVEVEAVDSQALIGMSLMEGYELRVRVASGGEVSIRAAGSGEADSGGLE